MNVDFPLIWSFFSYAGEADFMCSYVGNLAWTRAFFSTFSFRLVKLLTLLMFDLRSQSLSNGPDRTITRLLSRRR